jgi:hypothetical protein
MGLTILAIPFLILGVLASPYALDGKRCFGVGSGHKNGYCFEPALSRPAADQTPEGWLMKSFRGLAPGGEAT